MSLPIGCVRWMAFGLVALAATVARATTEYFVDPVNGQDGEGRGTSEKTAFLSIQAAVDAAAANDIITLLPGDHIAGVTNITSTGNSRVHVTKKLTIRSKNGRASRDTTRIVGARGADVGTGDTPQGSEGMSADCVRCVSVASNADGTTFEGLTFYRGTTTIGKDNSGYGGGLFVLDGKGATVVDCAFVECWGRNGAAMGSSGSSACTVARCLFKSCRVWKFGIFRGGSCYNCVFDDNDVTRNAAGAEKCDGNASGGFVVYAGKVVNCTFFGNSYRAVNPKQCTGVYNCLFMNNGSALKVADGGAFANCVSSQSDLTVSNCVYVAYPANPEVFSPGDGDYRLVQGAASLTAAAASYVQLIPAAYRDTDYYGNPRTTGGTVYCGAVQAALDEPASGLSFNSSPADGHWEIGGKQISFCNTLIQRVGKRTVVNARYVANNGMPVGRYTVDKTSWPLADDTTWLCNRYDGQVSAVARTLCASVIWVAANGGSDTDGDGTEANPYASIQKAVDVATTAGKDVAIKVKAGDYNSGETTLCGLKNRVVVTDAFKNRMRIIAVDGPERTFITGAEDPAGTGDWKVGTGGVRCVAVTSTNGVVAIQGFTLRGGRAAKTGSNDASRGAALINKGLLKDAPTDTCELIDCVITNCAAGIGSCNYGGVARRCRIVGCGVYDGLVRSGSAYSTLMVRNPSATSSGANSRVLGQYANVYNCTMCENGSYTLDSRVSTVYSSVCSANGYYDLNAALSYGTSAVKYSIYGRLYGAAALDASCVCERPARFRLSEPDDYTLLASSAGAALASSSVLELPPMDVNGDPFVFGKDGTYAAGAFTSMSVSDRVFYVDAVQGNDANDGLTEATAFKTLVKSMEGAAYGDKVIALPGTYAEGTALETLWDARGEGSHMSTLAPTIPNRVAVKPGVTLESRDGAEATVILGATETRCVFLAKDATLRGFTVTGGDVLEIDGDTSASEGERASTVNTSGAGIMAYSGRQATDEEYLGLVENCIISNNFGRLGSGGLHGTYRNCLFENNVNKINKPGYAARYARLEGCVLANNGNKWGHSVVYGSDMYNCTVLGNQGPVLLQEGSYARELVNSVVLTEFVDVSNFRNCVFASGVVNRADGVIVAANCVTGTVAEIALDANGVPQRGSLAIDFGANADVPAGLTAAGDPVGTQRVMNGTVDAGAYEYDWRGDYSTALARRRLTVTDVPPDATLVDGKLVWTDGTVKLDWAQGGVSSAYEFDVVVASGATLTVTLNGATLGTYTSSQHVQFESEADLNHLVFTAEGSASISSFVHRKGMFLLIL